MGEYAEMMLDGDVCGTCGCHMDGEGDGFPRYCSDDCDPFHDDDTAQAQQRPSLPKGKTKEQWAQSIVDKALSAIKMHGNSGWSKADHKRFAERLRSVIQEGIDFKPSKAMAAESSNGTD
jgi:hypothetical protein